MDKSMPPLRGWGHSLRLVLEHGLPRIALAFDAGIGDELLCTCLGHELHQRGQGPLWMLTKRPELFANSPDFDQVAYNYQSLRILLRLRRPAIHPYYAHWISSDQHEAPKEHFLKIMLRQVGVTGPVDLRPYLYLKEEEIAAHRFDGEIICVQSSGLSKERPILLKEWYPERFQQVVDSLVKDFTVVQVGLPADPPMKGAIDVRGKYTLRQVAALFRQSRLFLGLEGGLMHLARSVDCRSVIVYGGRYQPFQCGYPCNENITRQPACSPCCRWSLCEFDRKCMDQIEAPEVLEGVYRALKRLGQPLEIETANL